MIVNAGGNQVILPYCYFILYDLFTFFKMFHVGVQPISSVVIVSGGQQRDSAVHTHASILPKTPCHPGLYTVFIL